MNIFKSPEQYALMLIDAADGKGFVALDMLKEARTLYRMPDNYYRNAMAVIEHYTLDN